MTKVLQRSIAGLGTGPGVRLAIADLRRSTSERVVTPPGEAPAQRVRLGRRETDLATFVHVFGHRCYEFDEIGEPRWIIDAGANVGYSAAWFATRYPTASVLAIEPDDDNFEMLLQNTAGLDNVIALKAALSDRPGEALVVDPGQGSWGMQVQRADQRWSTAASRGSVPCLTVDQLVRDHGIDCIDVLKLDIEGGELDVLQSSGSWMPLVQVLVAELHDRFRSGCTRAFIEATQEFPIEVVRGENFLVARSPSDRDGLVLG